MFSRRQFLGGIGALSLLGSRVSFATVPSNRRLVVVVLRGGMDGLAAVPPWGDPAYRRARGRMALPGDAVLELDGTFGLHRALTPLHALYQKGQLLPIHAVSTPYDKRSHFDGQDVLENGTATPHGRHDGWLNRALGALDAPRAASIGASVPLLLRGPHPVTSIDPRRPAGRGAAFLDQLEDLYADDKLFSESLRQGLNNQQMLAGMDAPDKKSRRRNDITAMSTALASMLTSADGPNIAVIEAGGWDTHANQGTKDGRLTRLLTSLGGGIEAFRTALGPAWDHTAVLVVTEFGRTVRANGTGGTDHGVGGVALLAGGPVNGGRVHADWPGLAPKQLHQGRDLRATTDLRAVFKGVLMEQLGLPRAALDDTVFPDSADVSPLRGLIS